MLRSIVWNSRALLSTKPYQLGDIIHTLRGTIVSTPTPTSIQLNETEHVEDPYGAYMNHSCLPNTIIYHGRIIAIRNITPGHELTFNYRENETTTLANTFTCFKCNTMVEGAQTICPVYKSSKGDRK